MSGTTPDHAGAAHPHVPPHHAGQTTSPTLLILVLCFGGMLASYMMSLVVPISGELGTLLGTTDDNASWVVTATLIASAIVTPIGGRLADMIGRRRVIILALSSMIVGSLLCALTSDLLSMIVGRALQGLAMVVIPVGISLLRDQLPPERVPGAMATMSATLGVGGAIGMPLAAWIPDQFDWHVLFWTSAVAAAVLLVATLWVVRESPVRNPSSFDYVGALMLSAALVGILVAISKGRSWGWSSATTLGCGLGGIALLVIFVLFELRLRHPLVDVRTAATPKVALTNLVSVMIGFTMMGIMLAGPQILQMPAAAPGFSGMGRSLVEAGLWIAPGGLMMLFMSPISSRLNVACGPRLTLALGSGIVAVGYIFTALLDRRPWEVMVGLMLAFTGIGIAYSAMPTLIMSAVPPNHSAAANGLNSLMRSVGASIASALLVTVLTSSTQSFHGQVIPTETSFRNVFLIGIVVAVLATLISLTIPRDRKRRAAPEPVFEAEASLAQADS